MNDAGMPLSWAIQTIADQAVNIDFGEVIDAQVNQRVTSLAAAIRQQNIAGVTGCIPTYRSLTVTYDSVVIRQRELIQALELLLNTDMLHTPPRKCWLIPACYGGDYGIDLASSATCLGLTPAELIEIHSAQPYRIYMIGFMPGFAYLGGLDPRLHLARRTSPRQEVPGGSISIGGVQSAIGSVAAPSGWHLLARTPVKSFDPQREQPFLFNAGEEVRFVPVSEHDYQTLLADRHYQPEWSLLP
ncbi:5-oxoprolinase subunit PxpB [Pantoea cypripedii]|nr:5-oxoprolinase subunit PxpB [Pantoea cypripedii]